MSSELYSEPSVQPMHASNARSASPAASVVVLEPRVLATVACAVCHGELVTDGNALRCIGCRASYPRRGTVVDLRPASRESVQGDEEFWNEHWSDDKQQTIVQRFFSFYRKTVFARTVQHFTGTYFAERGVFVEAGCGTAETSMRIDTMNGERRLVALDLVPAVLEQCHPIMHVRLGGDIFRLPFADDSLDGIWNVGVMEHFTHEQIDRVLAEFRRVLKPRGRVVLLWPGSDSIPQKMLEAVAFVVNRVRPPKATEEQFRFHPPEISRLRSRRHGREVLGRNGFDTVTVDPGFYSLMAFKTVVGEKPASNHGRIQS